MGKEHEDYEWFQTMMLRSMELGFKPASLVADQRCGFSIFDQPAACLPLQPETHSIDEERTDAQTDVCDASDDLGFMRTTF